MSEKDNCPTRQRIFRTAKVRSDNPHHLPRMSSEPRANLRAVLFGRPIREPARSLTSRRGLHRFSLRYPLRVMQYLRRRFGRFTRSPWRSPYPPGPFSYT
eukprot:scaffold383_cov351-Pavlova_lutheri.AAC.3